MGFVLEGVVDTVHAEDPMFVSAVETDCVVVLYTPRRQPTLKQQLM